ncbi:MAG TPA: DUF6600 domain-containing protein, partial [Candidatus Tectomicrobia bacterium]
MRGKRGLLILLATFIVSGVGIGGWRTPGPAIAHERDVDDVSVFYEALTPYGTWIVVEEYGQVWVPRGVPPGWRPYTDGRWVYTEVGWTWVSDWDWGWAPFHYGRWAFSRHHGWYWVPGTVWGPAWVAWRHSPGWVGWAPLPPRVGFHANIGLGAADIHIDIAPSWFCFVEERHILAPRVHTFITPPTRNVQLVHITQNVTNYTVINNRIVDRSIDVKHVEKVIHRPVVMHRIVETDSPAKARGPRVRDQEREVVLVRPSVAREHRDEHDRELRVRPEQEQARERYDNSRGRHTDQGAAPGLNERLSKGRAALEERQRQERQNRPEGVSEEVLRQRHEAERKAFESRVLRQRQGLQQNQAPEQRRDNRSGAAEDGDRRSQRKLQQEPLPDRQQAPAPRTTEDPERRGRRQHWQQLHEKQGIEQRQPSPANQRQQPPTNQGDDNTARDRRNASPASPRGMPPVQPRNLVPASPRGTPPAA